MYKPGDQIFPGSWGRIILGLGPGQHRFYAEYLFEKIRRGDFPDAPSRMDAAFAFESVEFAKTWDRDHALEYVYSVRIADPSALTHRGNMSWIDTMSAYRSFDGVEECARHYWRGDDHNPLAWEIVTLSDLIVEDRLTSVPEDGN